MMSQDRAGRTSQRLPLEHPRGKFVATQLDLHFQCIDDGDNMDTNSDADLSDITQPKLPGHVSLSTSLTAPIPIASSISSSRSRSRASGHRGEDIDILDDVPWTSMVEGRAKRNKKSTRNRGADLALTTVRGFTPTPALSADEDSDLSPHRRVRNMSNITSVTRSPSLRPTSRCGGISTLRQQLEAFDLESVLGTEAMVRTRSKLGPDTPITAASSASDAGYDSDKTDMTSYEIPLEHDFVSDEAEAADQASKDPSSLEVALDHVHRKMTAADFQSLTCLGKGTFGTVHLVKQVASGRLYAQKMFRKASLTVHKSLIEQTKTERVILESINRHPFVVKLYYAFQDQEKLYLILEYAQGGELFTHLANERMFPEDTASFYMAEMVLALEHLHHTVGVVYRDLKPENCLLDAEGHLLLTDFGLSKVAVEGADRCNSILGTLEYMAPEIILGHFYGNAVDWWSFGALGFDLLTGSPPFTANNHRKIQEKIVRSKLSLPYFLSPDAKDLLTRLLRKEPNKRLGGNMPKDMQIIKKHRFFRKIDWNLLERREMEPPIKPLITDPALAENFSSEFTNLPMSPDHDVAPWNGDDESNPFGGFSFVAPKSMLAYESFLSDGF